jgi:hypothetical protein
MLREKQQLRKSICGAVGERLDEVQSVFVPHLEAKQFSLGDDVAATLRNQMDFLLTGPARTTIRICGK